MAEDNTEAPQTTLPAADATTVKSDLPDFEVPKGPITPEHQAFLVNADLVRKDLETRKASLPEGNGLTRSGVERELQQLEHAGKYLKGQPHDQRTAESGIYAALTRARDRALDKNTIKDPDDAAAAANEIPLLNEVLAKFEADHNI